MKQSLNIETVKLRLARIGYKQPSVDQLIIKLANADQDIIDAINIYLEDKTITDLSFEEFTLTKLMNERHLNFFNAIGTIDWLRRSPEIAKEALCNMQDSIRLRGESHD